MGKPRKRPSEVSSTAVPSNVSTQVKTTPQAQPPMAKRARLQSSADKASSSVPATLPATPATGALQVRKKVDPRIRSILQLGIQNNHRSLFVIIGDRGREQVVNLHLFLAKARIASLPSVLWCYKKELGFTSHRKKRTKLIQKQIKAGIRDPDLDDPFELFLTSTDIRYTYYKETHKILGNSFGMCVLQDFEALTPNLLARTIETVQGGGIVVLLLKTLTSLKQLYTMVMDVHARYRTESHQDITCRFNERFLLSLSSCPMCLIVDDELNVLPISLSRTAFSTPTLTTMTSSSDLTLAQKDAQEEGEDSTQKETSEQALGSLKTTLKEELPVGPLVALCATLDQAKAVLTFLATISEKTLCSTVALTAARGRGKSAALGLSMAAAIAYGYSNVFVTSPTPENLKTLFEFLIKGLEALGYKEHLDYDLVQSTNPKLPKCIVRMNVFKSHRQTIQYLQPEDAHLLGQSELLVIDEAASIPLPIVKKLMGPYLIFLSSTVHGYEGTGRSLSLKLIQSLRQTSISAPASATLTKSTSTSAANSGDAGEKSLRKLKELTLSQPIRYAEGDPVETWLNHLLCLDATVSSAVLGCPHPSECQLFYVSRDTLFSFHPISELFLQKMMALYVSSHYKNTPNDLQLMSDAPAHHLFVLLPPTPPNATSMSLPEPIVVLQICMEGQISKQSVALSLARGQKSDGDLIPWCMSQQFQDDSFAMLSGARVVRIATHPDYMGMGYGTRALELLEQYYRGDFDLLEDSSAKPSEPNSFDCPPSPPSLDLNREKINVRQGKDLPPLLLKLSFRPPEKLDWLGVSYGMTRALFRFWKRHQFFPVYLRQTSNDITGEHTCIMLKALTPSGQPHLNWVPLFSLDFCRRFIHLLGYDFQKFDTVLAVSIFEAAHQFVMGPGGSPTLTCAEIDVYFTPHDMKRLEGYTDNLLDYHVILDLVPRLAQLYFSRSLFKNADLNFTGLQQSILLGLGLQHKSITQLEAEFRLPSAQIMSLFLKMLKRFRYHLRQIQLDAIPLLTTTDKKAKTTEGVSETPISA